MSFDLPEFLNEEEAEAINRAEFLDWLSSETGALKKQLQGSKPLDPKTRKKRVARAKKDFRFFATTYFPHYLTLKGKNRMHEYLFDTVFLAQTNETSRYDAIAAPRGNAKTTLCSKIFPIYCIAYKYHMFIVELSDAVELVESNLEAIKTELEYNERLKADFPEICGSSENWKVGEFTTKNGIKMKAFGSGKRLRGATHGTYRPTLAIIDDLENDTNVRSRKQRDKLEEWLDEAVDNLGYANGTLNTLYIGTILHKDSVLSRKLQLKFWNPKIFRALDCFPDRMDLWDEYGQIYTRYGVEAADGFYKAKKAQMDAGAQKLWDAVPLDKLMQKRAKNLKAFNKEQQNNPLSEHQKFLRDRMHFYKNLPANLVYYGWLDPAGASKKSDYTSACVIGLNKETGQTYVAESWNKVTKSEKTIQQVFDLQRIYNTKIFGVETNGGQFHLKEWLIKESKKCGVRINLRGYHSKENKEDRIEALEFPLDEGVLLLHPSQTLLIEQLEDFPEGDNDDAPDALERAFWLAKQKNRRRSSRRSSRRTRTANIGRNPYLDRQ